jgi:hypothetical protein
MKCHDCGKIFTSITHTSRMDICDPCWETRMELVEGKIVPLGSPEFKAIQKKMAGGRGTAKRYIDTLRGGGIT